MQRCSTLKYVCTILCIILVLTEITTQAPTYADYENSLKDLYELLLQREALDENLGAHQVTRKSSRTPSLRLRFGRRSDPNLISIPYVYNSDGIERGEN